MPVTTARLFDSHCHFDLPELASEQAQHWQQAQHAGVAALLIPAVAAEYWPALLELHQQHSYWHIALGIHPWWVDSSQPQDLPLLAQLLQQHSADICAIGEIGLDFAIGNHTFDKQQQIFSQQLTLAATWHKPVILHHRKSQSQLLAEIKQQQFTEGGILHAFSGSQQQAMAFVDQGFKLGIGGTITYERAAKTRHTVTKLPLSCFVLETDAPAMPLSGFQGQINTPAQLARVFQAFCALRPEEPAEIAATLWRNSCEVLRLN
ncbi:TatD family hydrolase [Chromatiaceae bacterium AAb-1]|nr:TatD family hydrolase [Chromatiaceae bacterium AAb-1]